MIFKIGKLYEYTCPVPRTLYSLDYKESLGYMMSGNLFMVLDYCEKPFAARDSYKILFYDGNLYQITFPKFNEEAEFFSEIVYE